MKVQLFAISIAALVVPLSLCNASDSGVTADMVYSADNIRRLEPLARTGNGTAAMTLFAYYSFYHQPHAPEDNIIARRWLEVAVQDGDPEGMLELATITIDERGSSNCKKAVALIHRARGLTRDADFNDRAQSALNWFKKSGNCPK